jgi:hypothetical protein
MEPKPLSLKSGQIVLNRSIFSVTYKMNQIKTKKQEWYNIIKGFKGITEPRKSANLLHKIKKTALKYRKTRENKD